MRNRLFILLFFAVVIALFVIAKMYGGFGPWFLFGAAIVLVIYEVLFFLLQKTNFTVERELSAMRLRAGDQVHVKLSIRWESKTFLPMQWVRVEENAPSTFAARMSRNAWTFFPYGKKTAVISYCAKPLSRGAYRFTTIKVTSGDLFGLFSWQREVPAYGDLIVYPMKVPTTSPVYQGKAEQGMRLAQGKTADDAAKVVGIRDYVPGDRLSRIHWPATARTGALRSKEFENYSNQQLFFLLDVSAPTSSHDDFEYALSLTASMMEKAYREGVAFGFLSFHHEVLEYPVSHGEHYLFTIFEQLAMLEPSSGFAQNDPWWRIMMLPKFTTIWIITPSSPDQWLQKALVAKEKQLVITFFFVLGREMDGITQASIRSLRGLGFSVYRFPEK